MELSEARPALTAVQQERYARHLLLDGWGGDGQERLLAATVRVRGAGTAALWAARYLVSSGVGTVVLSASVAEACRGLNPDVKLIEDGAAGPGSEARAGARDLQPRSVGVARDAQRFESGAIDLDLTAEGSAATGAKAALELCAQLVAGAGS